MIELFGSQHLFLILKIVQLSYILFQYFNSGADAIKKFTSSLGILYLQV